MNNEEINRRVKSKADRLYEVLTGEVSQAVTNTDKEIWRECPEDYYSNRVMDSIHVTKDGGIGINCGGHVRVMRVGEWHSLAAEVSELIKRLNRLGESARAVYTSLAQSPTFEIPPIVLRDLAERLEKAEKETRIE